MYKKNVLKTTVVLILICCLIFTFGCSENEDYITDTIPETDNTTKLPESSNNEEEPEDTDSTDIPSDTQPDDIYDNETDSDVSLVSLKQAMIETPQVLAVAYFGYTYTTEPVPPKEFMAMSAPQLCENLPFVVEITEERIVGSEFGELYCIVPSDENATVSINGVVIDEYGNKQYDTVLYRSETGEPLLLLCNNTGWNPNTQVTVTNSDGTVLIWYPQLDDTNCVNQVRNDYGETMIMDFSPYEEILAQKYSDEIGYGMALPAAADLNGTSWAWEGFLLDDSYVEYYVTFNETDADIRWNDGYEEHEYNGAAYSIVCENGYAVLEFDFGGLAGTRLYNVLLDTETDMLFIMKDVSEGYVVHDFEPLYRYLYSVSLNVPDPYEMIGTWERFKTEADGYEEFTEGGVCTVEITGTEDTLFLTYTNNEFPNKNCTAKELIIVNEGLYYGCGNDVWSAMINHMGDFGEIYYITLTDNGELIKQNLYYLDGAPAVSYEWFCRP